MTPVQMAQYDLFLDENDWDIYYWATQEQAQNSQETTVGTMTGRHSATTGAMGGGAIKQSRLMIETNERRQGQPGSGEWAQTVGTFRPAYRPVPLRWKDSEILVMLRRHVQKRSGGGIQGEETEGAGKSLGQKIRGPRGVGTFFLFT
jgi:hypothetical protein